MTRATKSTPMKIGQSGKTPPALAAENPNNVLQIQILPGVSKERQLADLATDGIVTNAMTAQLFLGSSQSQIAISELVASLRDQGQRVNANDLDASEQMLMAQSIALNAIFSEMARRSALNLGEYLDASERYMRLALKAQGQCRATVETLAAIKNPPVVFAKQANITSGPQQINNGVMPSQKNAVEYASGFTPAHEETKKPPIELLEKVDDTRLDARAQGQTGIFNPWLATVEAIHRANLGCRKSKGFTQQP